MNMIRQTALIRFFLVIIAGLGLLLVPALCMASSAPCSSERAAYEDNYNELKALDKKVKAAKDKYDAAMAKQRIGHVRPIVRYLHGEVNSLYKEHNEKVKVTDESYEAYKRCVDNYNSRLKQ